MKVLSEEQIAELHSATLEVLERIGVRLTHPKAREVLAGAGARISGDRARIPAWLVEQAIRAAPHRLILGKRNGERSVVLEGAKYYYGPSLDCIEYLDPQTNERRPFTADDCRITSTVCDALPNYTWAMTIGMAADCPPTTADRFIVKQVLTYTEKPLVFCCKDTQSVADIYAMAVLVAGGEERFRQAPNIVMYGEPVSPLTHFDPAMDKLVYCVERGIPVLYYPGAMMGGTAPMSLAGAIAQTSAESLSGIVVGQLLRPGAPMIYGAAVGPMEMKTTIFPYGAPELALATTALAQLAQSYGLPFFGFGGATDAKFPDAQAGIEAAFQLTVQALGGANLIHDCGWMDHGCIASPSYMVLVHDVTQMVDSFARGVPINQESLALDLIEKAGPGGHFLTEEHTLQHFREMFYSRIFDRTIKDDWIARGSKRLEEKLREATLKAMQHQPAPLPAGVPQELARMAATWK